MSIKYTMEKEGDNMPVKELHNKDIDDVLRLVKNIYHTIAYVNLTDGSFRCIQSNQEDIKKPPIIVWN